MARPWAAPLCLLSMLAGSLSAAEVVDSGGALGTDLSPGPVDIEGDGVADIVFVSFGPTSNFLDASGAFGLVGNIGSAPSAGAAWVRGSDARVAIDGVGRNEFIDSSRGAVWPSTDNWSKVNLSSGPGWIQWRFGANRNIVRAVVFVREGVGEDLSAEGAFCLAYGARVIRTGGALGTTLTPGPVDIEGDGVADVVFVSFGPDSNFLDANGAFGLVGNIGSAPSAGAAWVRGSDARVTIDGVGRNEFIDSSRGAVWPSTDNWSKVNLSSGPGWVQWEIGATRDLMRPVVFVREGCGVDLSAAGAVSATEAVFKNGFE